MLSVKCFKHHLNCKIIQQNELWTSGQGFLRSRLGFNGDPMLNLILRCVGKPHLRVRDFTKLPIRDYVIEIVAYFNGGIEGRWLFFGKDSDDSRMKCLKSVLGMEKVNLIKRSCELYEFIDKVCIEVCEIHTDSYYAIPWI